MTRIPTPLKFLIALLFLTACSAQSKLATISGKITISSSLASKVGPSDVVFVMAFPAGTESQPLSGNPESNPASAGPPVAVRKIAPPVFPLNYQLSQEDVIFPEKRFEGTLQMVARIDKDGNAKTIQEKDLEGVYKKNPAAVGSKNVDILIDKEK